MRRVKLKKFFGDIVKIRFDKMSSNLKSNQTPGSNPIGMRVNAVKIENRCYTFALVVKCAKTFYG